MFVINYLFLIFSILVLIPIFVFSFECLLSVILIRKRSIQVTSNERPSVAVLVPAHDEQEIIEQTLKTVLPTLGTHDRLIVIADNCSDETAAVARSINCPNNTVTVLERDEPDCRGKSYALEFGIQFLKKSPPDVVVVLDADCSVDEQLVPRITEIAAAYQRPVQGRNLSTAESTDNSSAGSVHAVSELGFRFKNLVRPFGSTRLGLPYHLMGTGMAIPWNVLQKASFAGGHLAEDMQFGVDLALKGYPALFCPEVGVTSRLPETEAAFLSQRTRWEQGHLRTSLTQVPRLFIAGLLKARLSLLFLAVDLTVPPLSLLILIWLITTFSMVIAGVFGASWLPALLLLFGGSLMLFSIAVGWFAFCRHVVSWNTLLSIPRYILRKVPIYMSYFIGKKQKEWVRTERNT